MLWLLSLRFLLLSLLPLNVLLRLLGLLNLGCSLLLRLRYLSLGLFLLPLNVLLGLLGLLNLGRSLLLPLRFLNLGLFLLLMLLNLRPLLILLLPFLP